MNRVCSRPSNTSRATPIKSLFPLLALLAFFFTAAPVYAQPAIVNIEIGSTENLVTVNARLIDGFTSSILEAIESGIPMTFTYKIELRKINVLWADSLVSDNTIQNTVHYDSLKKNYRFSSIGKNVQRRVITRESNLYQNLMLALEDIPIASLAKLNPDEQYYIRVKADLETDRFWFPFNYIFFFVPFNDIKTAWAASSPLVWEQNEERASVPVSPKSVKKPNEKPKAMNDVLRAFNQ